MKRIFLLAFVFSLFACENYPKDPKDSYQEAKTSGLQVGVAINPPFTIHENGNFSGSEIQLIEGFAQEKGLEIHYTTDAESELIELLEKHKLHLLIGGFGKKTLWNQKTGLSTPYDGKHVILIAKGENQLLFELEGFIFKHNRK